MTAHVQGRDCASCDEKLRLAHPRLADWFRGLKKRYENAHVSSSWRDQEEQNRIYRNGKSSFMFPKSKHNHRDHGEPCSLALDIFQIDEDGVPRYSPMFYAKVNADNERDKEPIKWGGKFKSFGEANHYELIV